jgi:Nif-specific regulatory protein
MPPPTSAEADDEEDWDSDEVLRVGPSSRLQDLPAHHISPTPPEDDRDRLIWALEQCGWVQAKAARLLRVTPRQLGYALQKHRIEVRKL